MSTYISGYFANTINKDQQPTDSTTLNGDGGDPAATLTRAGFYLAATGVNPVTATLPSSEALGGQAIIVYANGAGTVTLSAAMGDAILPVGGGVVAADTALTLISDGAGNWVTV